MQWIIGNQYALREKRWYNEGEALVTHRHPFGHMRIVMSGAWRLLTLCDVVEDADGRPIKWGIEREIVVAAEDDEPWDWIAPGKWHAQVALRDRSSYLCTYAHQMPQLIPIAGDLPEIPMLRVDEDGTQWVRVNPKISQVSTRWSEQGVR